MLTILGAKGEITDLKTILKKIEEFSSKNNVTIQLFRADMIYNRAHLESAVIHAQRAFERKKNTAKTLALEILLYASGERQIRTAIKKMGVRDGDMEIAIVVVGNCNITELLLALGLTKNDAIFKEDIEVLKRFGISDEELKLVSPKNLNKLILEKVAMVDVIK